VCEHIDSLFIQTPLHQPSLDSRSGQDRANGHAQQPLQFLLQIVEFMAEHGFNNPGGFTNHQCAELQITADSNKPLVLFSVPAVVPSRLPWQRLERRRADWPAFGRGLIRRRLARGTDRLRG